MKALNEFYLPLVCREHGHKVVRYSLGLEDGDSLESIEWTSERVAVLQLLLGGVSVADLRHEHQQKQYRNAIYGYNGNTQDSILRSARRSCGGNTSDIDFETKNNDLIVTLLQQMVNRYELDIQMSIKPGAGIPLWGTYGDGVAQQLIGSILQDARFRPLRRAFELQDKLSPHSSMPTCRRTSGHSSGSLMLNMIPAGLIHACATRVLIRGELLSCSNMRNEAKGVVSDLASLIAGERVALPAAVGAVGSQLVRENRADQRDLFPAREERPIAATDRVEAGDGYLRPTVTGDERIFQMAVDSIGLVWVTTRDTRILLHSLAETDNAGEDEVGEVMKQLGHGIVPLQEKWAHVAQAIALGSQEEPPPGLAMSEIFVSGVLEPWGEQSSARLTAQGESAWRKIAPSAMGDIGSWQGRLAEAPLALDVSRRRLVSALAERNNVTDSLVDAVVAWEAIFSGSPETQMRTVLPSCRLLGKLSDRTALLKEMKQVYGLRSQVVHGKASKKVSDADIGKARDKAIRWVIELLRVLFAERQDLLEMSAWQRSDAVLLEA